MLTKETSVGSVVMAAGGKWLRHPRPKMGWCRACRVRTSASVVSVCTRRRGGSYGLLYVCCAGTGELPHRSTYVVGPENASVREGGRRRRSSQTPRCNDG